MDNLLHANQRVVHSIIGVCPNNIYIYIYGPTFYRSLSNEPSRELKQKPFVLEIIFIHGKKNVCEGVHEDSRHEAWHMTFI